MLLSPNHDVGWAIWHLFNLGTFFTANCKYSSDDCLNSHLLMPDDCLLVRLHRTARSCCINFCLRASLLCFDRFQKAGSLRKLWIGGAHKLVKAATSYASGRTTCCMRLPIHNIMPLNDCSCLEVILRGTTGNELG